jgi:hypothetical protein
MTCISKMSWVERGDVTAKWAGFTPGIPEQLVPVWERHATIVGVRATSVKSTVSARNAVCSATSLLKIA